MTTAAASLSTTFAANDGCTDLYQYLDNGLAKLWDLSQTPVWLADCSGRILYANPAALQTDDIQLNGTAARWIAAAANSGNTCHRSDDKETIDITPLLDGHGRRIGWLAMGHTAA